MNHHNITCMPLFCKPALQSYKLTRYVHAWCPLVWLSLPTATQLFPAATEEPFCTKKYKLWNWHTISAHKNHNIDLNRHVRPADRKKYITHKLLQSYTEIRYKMHSQNHIHEKQTQTSKITPHSLDSYTHLWCTGLASLVQHAQHFWFYPIHQKNTLMTAHLWKQANDWQVQTIIFKKHQWVQISTQILDYPINTIQFRIKHTVKNKYGVLRARHNCVVFINL